MLDKLGIQPDVQQREEFKSMANMLRDKALDEPLKQQYSDLLEELTGGLAQVIAEQRQVSVERVRGWLEGGPYTADEALRQGLIDGVAELDVFYSTVLPQLFAGEKVDADKSKGESSDSNNADKRVDDAAEQAFQKRLLAIGIYQERRGSPTQCGNRRVLRGDQLPLLRDTADAPQSLVARLAAGIRRLVTPGPTVALVTLEGSIFDGA